jgi:hypothetical protein
MKVRQFGTMGSPKKMILHETNGPTAALYRAKIVLGGPDPPAYVQITD